MSDVSSSGEPGRRRGGQGGPGPAGPPGTGKRLLRARVPAWLALLGVLVVAVLFTVLLLRQDPVDFGPALEGAVNAETALTLCNETVDRRGINPRTTELHIEKSLRDLGVRSAKVRVDRIDCGPGTSSPPAGRPRP